MLSQNFSNHMGNSHTLRGRTITGLALTGAVSGLLTMALLEFLASFQALQDVGFALYVPGAVFALIVSAYCAIFMRIRSGARWLGLFVASVIANLIAFKLTIYIISPGWRVLTTVVFDGALFCGGAAGALVLLASAQLLFCTRPKWVATLRNASLWSLAGGALAVIGWELGGSLGKVLWHLLHFLRLPLSDTDIQDAIRTQNVNFCSLFVLWQAGIATVVGFLLSKKLAAQPERQSAASA
jgi:hypothetical protein